MPELYTFKVSKKRCQRKTEISTPLYPRKDKIANPGTPTQSKEKSISYIDWTQNPLL